MKIQNKFIMLMHLFKEKKENKTKGTHVASVHRERKKGEKKNNNLQHSK